uniref:Transmembrane protein 51 n=1 Tax=Naja naja TaxID=35670 RepID=A0A8C7E3X9_NAJNA
MMAQSRSSSGSHYALTAIGLGMLVLGVIMAVWNLVPGFGLSAKPHPTSSHHNETEVSKGLLHRNKTFSVAYVLVGAGVLLLLFSICLTIRDRRKPRHRQDDVVGHDLSPRLSSLPRRTGDQEDDNDSLSRYYVPSYEEAVNGLYPQEPRLEAERGTRISISLPSYESLTGLDDSLPTRPSPTAAGTTTGAERPPARQSSRLSKRLKPLKVRRIKSEKLHLKNLQLGGTPPTRVTIEPLTPPPQYDEMPPKLPDPREGEP